MTTETALPQGTPAEASEPANTQAAAAEPNEQQAEAGGDQHRVQHQCRGFVAALRTQGAGHGATGGEAEGRQRRPHQSSKTLQQHHVSLRVFGVVASRRCSLLSHAVHTPHTRRTPHTALISRTLALVRPRPLR